MADKHIDVMIVVSGVPQPVKVGPQDKLSHVIAEALRDTGNAGRAPEDFELRTDTGVLLDQSLRVKDVDLHDGQTLFLNPRAGAGG